MTLQEVANNLQYLRGEYMKLPNPPQNQQQYQVLTEINSKITYLTNLYNQMVQQQKQYNYNTGNNIGADNPFINNNINFTSTTANVGSESTGRFSRRVDVTQDTSTQQQSVQPVGINTIVPKAVSKKYKKGDEYPLLLTEDKEEQEVTEDGYTTREVLFKKDRLPLEFNSNLSEKTYTVDGDNPLTIFPKLNSSDRTKDVFLTCFEYNYYKLGDFVDSDIMSLWTKGNIEDVIGVLKQSSTALSTFLTSILNKHVKNDLNYALEYNNNISLKLDSIVGDMHDFIEFINKEQVVKKKMLLQDLLKVLFNKITSCISCSLEEKVINAKINEYGLIYSDEKIHNALGQSILTLKLEGCPTLYNLLETVFDNPFITYKQFPIVFVSILESEVLKYKVIKRNENYIFIQD